ncbi:MAG: DUF3016 domain-containing protein [Rhodanobacteraceae bacterium]
MKSPRVLSRIAAATVAALLVGGIANATQPATPVNSTVSVDWTNPADFTEEKKSRSFGLARETPEQWVGELARYVERRGARLLAPGQTLDVTFTDITRAGAFEPWRGPKLDDTRFIKDIYPPAIDLHFTLRNADGGIVLEGTRKLRDAAFLSRGTPSNTDPLRYEKRMLDDWLRRDFAPSTAS